MKFTDLPLSQPIQKMLEQRHLVEATEIQAQAIPALLEAKDLIGLSQTGTGKTLAFVLPILEQIDPESNDVQAIILSPTRELAQQTKQEVQTCSEFLPYIRSVAVYGGADIRQQIFALKRRPNIIIGTPGRILDHIQRHTLKLNNIKYFVLDEADEMFNMGFRNDIIEILEKTPKARQTLLFSATMNNEVLGISKEFMHDPIQIKVGQQNATLDSIKQTYFLVPRDKKKKALHALLREVERGRTLIFCNTKAMVGGIQSYLEKMGFQVSALHGDMPQSQRSQVMRNYKAGNVEILITTDVSARGIDVNDILHVINFDLPQNLEYYVHRIGRTGRAGKIGNAWTILNSSDQERNLREIQRKTKSEIVLGNLKLDNIAEIEQQHSYDEKTEPAIRTRTSRHGSDRSSSKPFRAREGSSRPFKSNDRGNSKPFGRSRREDSEGTQESGDKPFRSNSYSKDSSRSRPFKSKRDGEARTGDFARTPRQFKSENTEEYTPKERTKRDEYAPFKTTRTDKQRRKSFDTPSVSGDSKRTYGSKPYSKFGRTSSSGRNFKSTREGGTRPFKAREEGSIEATSNSTEKEGFKGKTFRTREGKESTKRTSYGAKRTSDKERTPFGAKRPAKKSFGTARTSNSERKPFAKDRPQKTYKTKVASE